MVRDPAPGPLPDHLVSAAQTRLRERQVFGLAVCGFDAGGERFAGGVGYADLARGEATGPTTVFRVASVSKLLVTALVLRLVDAGTLDLDDPVNDHLPPELHIRDRAGGPAGPPLRTLLSHSSGLPSGIRGATVGNPAVSYLANGGRVRTLADAISGLRLDRDPGTTLVYSNPAFNVLGYVAGRALGVPFEAAARNEVLLPLGMDGAEFTPSRRGPGVATHYGSIVPPGVGPRSAHGLRLVATPMGGLTASVLDLARFGRMVLNGGVLDGRRVLSGEALEQATSMEARNHPELEQGYGLGFKVRTWRGRTVVGHDGNMPGVAAQLVLSPDDGVGAVVLTNGFALGVPHELAALALEHLVGLPPQVVPGSPEPPPADERGEWVALGRRVEGSYVLRDLAPPGVLGRLADRFSRVRVTHEADGRLRVDGNPGTDGPAWLQPHRRPGRYRMAAAVDDGTGVVVEERPGGTDLWLSHTSHLTSA